MARPGWWGRPSRPRGAPGRPFGLTSRGALLFLVLFALAATAVYPLRQHVTQQDRIERLQAKQRALAAENRRLASERARLKDPAYVDELARRDFHVVRPGEERWVLTGEPPTTRPVEQPPEPQRRAPWYRRAWGALTGWLR